MVAVVTYARSIYKAGAERVVFFDRDGRPACLRLRKNIVERIRLCVDRLVLQIPTRPPFGGQLGWW